MKLSDKTIVITGASKGLGREIALRLCRRNPDLVLIARTKSLLEQTQKEIETLTGSKPLIIFCDISNETDVNRMAGIINERYKHVDVLINNAGIGIPKLFEDMTSDEMRRHFEVNFYGSVYCIKSLLPLLKQSHSAYILNIGSLLAELSFAETSIYSATKFALSGFSEGFRYEMKKNNIRVGFFLPGPMNTSFQDNRKQDGFKAPAFMTLNPQKTAELLEKMIINKKKKVYMYKWIFLLMKVKQLFG